MAYLIKPQVEEQELRSPGTAPAGTLAPSMGTAPAEAPRDGAASSGGDFIAFDRYFAANRDAANQAAGQLAGTAQRSAQAAQQGLQTAQNQFTQGLEGGMGQSATGVSVQGPTQMAMANRERRFGAVGAAPATNPAISIAEAQKRAQQTYTGPGSLADTQGYGAAYDAAKKAQEQTQALGSVSGREAMLREAAGGKGAGAAGTRAQGYTQGASRLDSALTGRAGGNRFRELRSQYGGLTRALDEANAESARQAQEASGATATAAGQYGQLAQAAEEQDNALRAARAQGAQLSEDMKRWQGYQGKAASHTGGRRFDSPEEQARYELAQAGEDPYDDAAVKKKTEQILARGR